MNCVICGIRKARRQCPGVQGQICAICCGREREESIDCPLGCEYLREAHKHERIEPLDPATLPNPDVRVPEEFVREHEWLLVLLSSAVADGALRASGTTDYDIRAGLEVLIDTYRSLQSGILYETKPANLFAANIQDAVQARVAEIRTRMASAPPEAVVSAPPMMLPDATVLAMLVFLQRLEYSNNNGRKRSRAFLDFLLQFHVPGLEPEESAEPREPLVIL
ncbi:MAG: hypothetical protein ABUS49_07050 [Acidobacteriota bacterium]